jgi:hypothetical protein
LQVIGNQDFPKISRSNSWTEFGCFAWELDIRQIIWSRAFAPEEIDLCIQAVVIPEVFRPCGEHCLVFLMTERPDFDLLTVGGLQSFSGVSQPFYMIRSPGHL